MHTLVVSDSQNSCLVSSETRQAQDTGSSETERQQYTRKEEIDALIGPSLYDFGCHFAPSLLDDLLVDDACKFDRLDFVELHSGKLAIGTLYCVHESRHQYAN